MNYKNGRKPKSVPLAWRALVTTHEGLIDRPKDPAQPEKGWPERGHDQTGKPWIDAKTWAVARVLDDHMDKDGTCWVSYGTVAVQARMGRTAAKDGVARLEGAGLLEKKQRRLTNDMSESNLYRALGVGAGRPGDRGGGADSRGRTAPQSPHEVQPSGLSEPSEAGTAPQAGKRCGRHRDVELYKGECWACEQEKYHARHGGSS